MIAKMIKNLENKMEKMESINKDLEELKNKHTETKNKLTESKNTLEGINTRISEAEEWISELEDKMVEITSEELLLLLSRFSRVRLCVTPQTAAHQAPPSLGFSRQEHWSGLPFPSPMCESEKWKWSPSVMSDS